MRGLTKRVLLPLRLLRRISRIPGGKKCPALWLTVFGLSVSAAWLMLTAALCLIAVVGGSQASEIIMILLAEASPLWGAVLGVLGIALVRDGASPRRRPKKKNKNQNN